MMKQNHESSADPQKKEPNDSEHERNSLWETHLASRHVYDGPLLQVYVDDVELPDGSSTTRDWIQHPGASAVLPVFEDGTVMLLKQFRYPARQIFVEVPAGKLDPGESPKSTAERELFEETGLSCTHLEPVGSLFPAIGYADEEIFSFVAWGLSEQEQGLDDDEFLLKLRLPFAEALRMIERGDIKDAKTIAVLVQTRMWWERHQPFPVSFS